ncbi:MAG TPA: hypothetical protein VFJ25_04655 [Casimicrobiaceae bacterium]|nr:hypothetical protein [Casimicrobiaceae bacterium]
MIQFPKLHIATSVTNRILNVADEIARHRRPSTKAAAASAPDQVPEGQALDAAIYAPKAPADADSQTADAIATAPLLR